MARVRRSGRRGRWFESSHSDTGHTWYNQYLKRRPHSSTDRTSAS